MKSFGLTELEISEVIKAVPSLAIASPNELVEKFSVYYPNLFIKRDIKEILSICPEFVSLNQDYVVDKIKEIAECFSIKNKKACELIRRNPNLLFYDSIKEKINSILSIGISKDYLISFSAISNELMNVLPVKFVLARTLNLENYFDKLVDIPLKTLLTRFIFMQNNNIFEHNNLLLSEEEFYNKYGLFGYNKKIEINNNVLVNIAKYYVSLKERLSGWKDIPFPAFEKIEKLINEKIETCEYSEYLIDREKENISFDVYKVKKQLLNFSLSEIEVRLVNNKTKNLRNVGEIIKIVEHLIKNDFTLEEIVSLIINRPSNFTYSYNDYLLLVNEISEHQNCSIKQAFTTFIN